MATPPRGWLIVGVEGTVRTYRAHHLGPDPLSEPGQTDITADVNFTAVMETAREAGASVALQRQDEFLENLGLRKKIEELRIEELQHARSDEENGALAGPFPADRAPKRWCILGDWVTFGY